MKDSHVKYLERKNHYVYRNIIIILMTVLLLLLMELYNLLIGLTLKSTRMNVGVHAHGIDLNKRVALRIFLVELGH